MRISAVQGRSRMFEVVVPLLSSALRRGIPIQSTIDFVEEILGSVSLVYLFSGSIE